MGFGPYATASMAAALEASASVAGRTLRGIMNFHRIESIDLYTEIQRRAIGSYVLNVYLYICASVVFLVSCIFGELEQA